MGITLVVTSDSNTNSAERVKASCCVDGVDDIHIRTSHVIRCGNYLSVLTEMKSTHYTS